MRPSLLIERVYNIKNISYLRRIYDNIEIQVRSFESLIIESSNTSPPAENSRGIWIICLNEFY